MFERCGGNYKLEMMYENKMRQPSKIPIAYDGWFDSFEEYEPFIVPEIKKPVQKRKTIPKQQKPTLRRTRFCKFGDTCRYKSCSFAHSLDELTPQRCNYDTKCKFKRTTCQYIHTSENKNQYVIRLGLKI